MKTSKSPIYFRYEFSDEKGRPEGGDVFLFSTMNELQEMAEKVLKVARADQVAVNFTIGQEKPFFGFLKNVGLSREDVEKEMVADDLMPVAAPQKSAKKASAPTKKKSAKKAATKKAKSKA